MKGIPHPVVRALAILFALFWLVPGFGLIDLTVTWDDDWPVVLEAGWGLFFTVVVAVPLLAVAVRPRRQTAPVAQLAVAAAALAVAALASREPGAAALAAIVGAQAALVARPAGGEPFRPVARSVDGVLVALGLASLLPWLAYGADMADLNRQELAESDITNGVDHFSVQAATAVALPALVLVAAVWPRGRRLSGLCVAAVAVYLGVVSFSSPGTPGGLDRAWSTLCVGWGAAVGAAATRRAGAPARP